MGSLSPSAPAAACIHQLVQHFAAWRASWYGTLMPPPAGVSETPYLAHATTAVTTSAGTSSRSSALVALFATTLFVSAFLMFLVEPMIARMVLPLLGGAPAVWNTCLVFFQFI